MDEIENIEKIIINLSEQLIVFVLRYEVQKHVFAGKNEQAGEWFPK